MVSDMMEFGRLGTSKSDGCESATGSNIREADNRAVELSNTIPS